MAKVSATATMNKPRALLELMTAADAGLVDIEVDSASLNASRRARYSRRRQSAPAAAETPPRSSTDASFEFSAAVSNSSASPASMVFSDGQLRAHQFPAVRSSTGSSQVASPVRSSSMGSTKAVATTGGKKRVSFAEAGPRKAAPKTGVAHGTKGGGLMGCMGSACGLSRNEVVEPAKNGANRKVLAV